VLCELVTYHAVCRIIVGALTPSTLILVQLCMSKPVSERGTRWRSSIPGGVIGIFHWLNPSCRTIALGSTQRLTEMSTMNTSWRVKEARTLGWQTYNLHVPIVQKFWEPQPPGTPGACPGLYRNCFTSKWTENHVTYEDTTLPIAFGNWTIMHYAPTVTLADTTYAMQRMKNEPQKKIADFQRCRAVTTADL
jgi:hypothetical protein